ncbi:MAG: DUF2231 domain-containing protein [Mesorhizobium sp.]
MAFASASSDWSPIHPLHAVLLAFPFPMFLAALASDIAYWQTFQIQWSNFSAWLIAAGLLGGGFAALWALIDLLRFRAVRGGRRPIYFVVLLAMFVLGLINALIHAKDAAATMPTGLYLSIIATLLALVAAWIGYSGFRTVEVR